MRRVDLLNSALLLATLALATWLAILPGRVETPVAPRTRAVEAPPVESTTVIDASGFEAPIERYERIVSLSTVADHVLLEIVEPDRLISITGYTAKTHVDAWRFGERPTIDSSGQLEAVLALRPDLVLVNVFADESYLTRLREADVRAFDLGEMRGVETTRANIRTLGALVDERERAAQLDASYVRELQALAANVPAEERVPGIYVSVFSDTFFGGTTGTSYADVLLHGGVRDLAAERGYVDWPQYAIEDLVAMNPPLIVTVEGSAESLRSHAMLRELRACGPDGRIVELDEALFGDAGLGIVEAAAELQRLVHPDRAE
ncbi:MAG: ABC transporter substrate-binding protein [Planctomycetota bacterium]